MANQDTSRLRHEIELRGEEIFLNVVGPLIKNEDPRKFVLIDVDTGDFEIDQDEELAAKRLEERRPAGRVWMRRVGSRTSRRFGALARRDCT